MTSTTLTGPKGREASPDGSRFCLNEMRFKAIKIRDEIKQ